MELSVFKLPYKLFEIFCMKYISASCRFQFYIIDTCIHWWYLANHVPSKRCISVKTFLLSRKLFITYSIRKLAILIFELYLSTCSHIEKSDDFLSRSTHARSERKCGPLSKQKIEERGLIWVFLVGTAVFANNNHWWNKILLHMHRAPAACTNVNILLTT